MRNRKRVQDPVGTPPNRLGGVASGELMQCDAAPVQRDEFPANDLAQGLKPIISDIFVRSSYGARN